MACDGEGRAAGDAREVGRELVDRTVWGGFGVGEDDGVCAAEGIDGFTEPARGEAALAEERSRGVDEDEVEVAVDAPVLEAVVEDDGVDALRLDEGSEPGEAIGLGDDREIREDGEVLGVLVGERGAGGTVASHGDGGAMGGVEGPAEDLHDEGGLPGAADGEVADADDGNGEACDAAPPVEGGVAAGDGEAVDGLGEACERRGDRGAVAGHGSQGSEEDGCAEDRRRGLI